MITLSVRNKNQRFHGKLSTWVYSTSLNRFSFSTSSRACICNINLTECKKKTFSTIINRTSPAESDFEEPPVRDESKNFGSLPCLVENFRQGRTFRQNGRRSLFRIDVSFRSFAVYLSLCLEFFYLFCVKIFIDQVNHKKFQSQQ